MDEPFQNNPVSDNHPTDAKAVFSDSDFEKERHDLLIARIILIGLFVASVITFPLFGFGLIFFIAAIIYWFACYKKKSKQYKLHYKQAVVSQVLNDVFDDVRYEPERGFTRLSVQNTEIFSEGNRYSSEDYISGRYKGVDFQRADVTIIYESTDSEGNTSTTTYFMGQWTIFPLTTKQIDTDMVISSKHLVYRKDKSSIFTAKKERRHKVETENMEFNKAFRVMVQKDSDAFYILTPPVMEAIMRVQEQLKKPFALAIIDGSLHFCLNNHQDSLEPPIGQFDQVKEAAKIRESIDPIISIIEAMQLDRGYQA